MRMKVAIYTISIRPFLFVALESSVKKMACGVDEEHGWIERIDHYSISLRKKL